MLPDFLILGAAKSATTWVARRLGQHPAVWVHPEELHFFSRHHERGRAWYEKRFQGVGSATHLGEKSNTYLPDPAAAGRIHALLPEAKLITVLREPVERAYSGYCMQLSRGKVSDDISRHLDPERAAGDEDGFLAQGLYSRHLRRFETLFAREQLEVRLYDDLVADRRAFIEGLLQYLGIDPGTLPAQAPERVNARRGAVLPPALGTLGRAIQRIFGRRPAGRRMLSRLASMPATLSLLRQASRPVAYPPLDEDLRRALERYYREDIAELEAWLARDLSAWRGTP